MSTYEAPEIEEQGQLSGGPSRDRLRHDSQHLETTALLLGLVRSDE